MGLERRGDRVYYYRKVRRGDRVVSGYMGSGTNARLMARLDEVDRERSRAEREEWMAERERLDAVETGAVDFCDRVDALVAELLEAAGYHRHKSGEWRKRHGTR
jgi:hypothetical protein